MKNHKLYSGVFFMLAFLSHLFNGIPESNNIFFVSESGIVVNNILIKDSDVNDHLDRFSEIAKQEQLKFGIPASISLAQSIIESSAGTASIASIHNNFFGIRYYSIKNINRLIRPHVEGYTIKHDDCRIFHKRVKPKQVEYYLNKGYSKVSQTSVCPNPNKFVHYSIAWASWRHHSYILMNKRYTRYNPKTFNDWAYALKAGGYATNEKYPVLLLNVINKYDLTKYDD